MLNHTRLIAAIATLSLLGACSTGGQTSPGNSQDQAAGAATSPTAQQAWQKAQAKNPCAELEPRDCYFRGMKLEAANKARQAVRYFEAACEAGMSSACYDLAVLYESGESVKKDQAMAKTLYEKACQSKAPDATACNNLAVMYQQGRAVEANANQASQLYRRSCELGSMLGCRNLARRYLEGSGVEKSATRAAALLEKACQLGHPQACPQLTYLYAHDCIDKTNECGVDAIDPAMSVDKLREVCTETNQPQACLGHGFMLEAGFNADSSEANKPDAAGAAMQYDQACKAGVSAGCNALANLYRRGDGVERSTGKAVGLYKQACEEGFMLSCHTLGVMNLRGRSLPPNPPRGYEYIRKACQGGRTASCTTLEFQCYSGRQGACE
jgi:TPR repeat protein